MSEKQLHSLYAIQETVSAMYVPNHIHATSPILSQKQRKKKPTPRQETHDYLNYTSMWAQLWCVCIHCQNSEEPPLQVSGCCLVGAHEEPNAYAHTNTDSQADAHTNSDASVEPWELTIIIVRVPAFRILHATSVHIIDAFIASSLPKKLILINRNLRFRWSQSLHGHFKCKLRAPWLLRS